MGLYSRRARHCWHIPVCFPEEMLQIQGESLLRAVVLLTGASWAGLGPPNNMHALTR